MNCWDNDTPQDVPFCRKKSHRASKYLLLPQVRLVSFSLVHCAMVQFSGVLLRSIQCYHTQYAPRRSSSTWWTQAACKRKAEGKKPLKDATRSQQQGAYHVENPAIRSFTFHLDDAIHKNSIRCSSLSNFLSMKRTSSVSMFTPTISAAKALHSFSVAQRFR